MKDENKTVFKNFIEGYASLAVAFQALNAVVEKTAKSDVGWIDEASPVVDMLEDGAKKFAKNFRKLIKLAREESNKNLA